VSRLKRIPQKPYPQKPHLPPLARGQSTQANPGQEAVAHLASPSPQACLSCSVRRRSPGASAWRRVPWPGGAHHTLYQDETRHNSAMAATLCIIPETEPLGRLRGTVVRRILLPIARSRHEPRLAVAADDLWRTTEKVVHMAWQQRGTKRYLYRSVKHQGRVLREYLGTGPSAEALYHAEVRERQQRHAAREAWRQTLADHAAIDAQVQRWWEQQGLLLQALLYTEGFYRHDRSVWRKRAASR
jgi:hypothetical protein